ncbi:MAG: HAMP domain-containing histidine kinase [Myxococcota bacterium]|nr:HAMP domain-containing histidine kinase [Myxococcota bacterium]
MLHEFITAQRTEIIARCRAKVSSRPAPRATDLELEHGLPMFLDQLIAILRLTADGNDALCASATRHGNDLLRRGFTVAQVVHDYGGIGQAIREVAADTFAAITTAELATLTACLDDAIAYAVTEYGRLREHEGTERLGRLAHDLRNQLNSGLLSYEMLKTGSVSIDSSTGSVLARSLLGLRNLIDRELAEVRLAAGLFDRQRITVSDLLEDLEVPAAMEATARNLELSVTQIARDVTVLADRAILDAVLANLLQNAFKFTRPKTHIVLRTLATADRVRFEIEDRCGGLPPGKATELFPAIEPEVRDRKHSGLGLVICARGVKINDGLISVRDVPGTGCVFTVDLPRQ